MNNLQIVASALVLAYTTLANINDQHGTGSIKSIAVDIDGTDLDNGKIKGHVVRTNGDKTDQRAFQLKVNKSGGVNTRFLNKSVTVKA